MGGKIVLWDNRSPKRTPVQRSSLSASAHTHPVYCLSVVGTQNSHSLISISTEEAAAAAAAAEAAACRSWPERRRLRRV